MLHELQIQNYAVIDNLRLEFEAGLNLLSGETGSGKSILIDALGLALGGRASPEVIRTGEERARITAVFRAEALYAGIANRGRQGAGGRRGDRWSPGAPARGGATTAPTFIFDEVDVGIGGRVAESVGQRLKRLAHKAQVLCVTHLAQIACFADRHLVVEKFDRAGRTVTESARHGEGARPGTGAHALW